MKRGRYQAKGSEPPKVATEADLRELLANAYGKDVADHFKITPIDEKKLKKDG
jgi:hypothetical protein